MSAKEPWAKGDPDDFTNLTEPLRAIRDAVPTSRHARMLFEMVVQLLGERAALETAGGGARSTLLCRDAPRGGSIIPWPLLQLGVAGRMSVVRSIVGPAEAPSRSGEPPRLRNLGPGEIVIHDGRDSVTVTYGDDGRWIETARSADPETLAPVLPVLARGTARPVELLAEYVASLDVSRHGPGRVLSAKPLPFAEGAWNRGLLSIRDALFDGRIPAEARWAVADGCEGTALAWGATRDEALAAWRAQVVRAPPKRSKSSTGGRRQEEVERDQAGGLTIRGVSADGEWPEAIDGPAVLIPLEPVPRTPSRWGSPVRFVGGFGGTIHARIRRDPLGFTLVHEDIADLLLPDELDRALEGIEPFRHPELDAARAARGGGPPGEESETIIVRVVDERTLIAVTPSRVESMRGHGFRGSLLDGDRLRLRAVRYRRLG